MAESKTVEKLETLQAQSLVAEEVLQRLESAPDGLSEAEASRRLQVFGLNQLPERKQSSLLRRFASQFNNILIYVLLMAAAITALLGHKIDTGVILAVVLANATIGFVQEGRAEQAMEAIRKMLSPRASVLREGRRRNVDSSELVPGDLVLLEAGDQVPADLRLLEATRLQVEEAVLTGESLPVEKSREAIGEETQLGERSCILFKGTMVAAGTARALVVSTGSNTELGRISGLLGEVERLTTPLIRQIDAFAKWLTLLILLVAGLLLIYGYFVGHLPFAELFMIVVGLSVAAIPEGLPAVLTITLAVGVRAMARRHAIVRRLPAIETLGSVSVICSDKTGTLTRNEMLAATLASTSHRYSVAGEGYQPEGAIHLHDAKIDPGEDVFLCDIARAAALCNDATLRQEGADWKVEGDPMEGALQALAAKIMERGPHPFAQWERIDEIPFDPKLRYMAVLHGDNRGHKLLQVKGAPEALLALCKAQGSAEGGSEPLDRAYWQRQIAEIAAEGQRLLAFAARPLPKERSSLTAADLEEGLVLLGLVGLIDPPRPEAIAAVAECREAGIRVKMITGDHAGTAEAIARQIGLENPGEVLTGAEIEVLDDPELAAVVVEADVFARTSPEHKLRLVTALQSHGLTVAMTGDGVNDAPALKRADTGIAMGLKGSEAAKEAAEIVLADDNFASIVAAVREGRTVYDNITKVIRWTLPTNAGEALTIMAALFLGLALPITAVQILWLNLVTAGSLGVALAFEATEPHAMRQPPRPRSEPLLSGDLAWHIIFISLLFALAVFSMYFYAIDQGYPPEVVQTISLNTLVVLEIFHLFFIRNIHSTSLTWKAIKGTPVIWTCVIVVALGQFSVTYLPSFQRIIGTAPVPPQDLLLIFAVGVVFFGVIEIEKQLHLVLRR